MKKLATTTIAIIFFMTLIAVPAQAARFAGELIDLACFMERGKKGLGKRHKQCGTECALDGMPIGLYTSKREVYLLFPSHDNKGIFDEIKKRMHTIVKIQGIAYEQGGIKAITVVRIK